MIIEKVWLEGTPQVPTKCPGTRTKYCHFHACQGDRRIFH